MTKDASLPARVIRAAVALMIGASVVVALPTSVRPAQADPAMSAAEIAVAFEWSIDVERIVRGLAPLSVDVAVSTQAQVWSGGMALFNTLAEDRFYGAELSAAAPTWRYGGENVGVGPTPASIEAAFMASPPHRANMLGPFTHVGVGVFVDGHGTIWVTERFYR